MNQFAAPQHISMAKLLAFYQRFQTEEGALRLVEAKITTENAFNGDHFRSEGNHEYSNNKKTFFWLFFEICDQCFNAQTAKYIFLRFQSLLWFLYFLGHLLLFQRIRVNLFYSTPNLEQKKAGFMTSPQCTSLLLRSKPLQRNYLHFFE